MRRALIYRNGILAGKLTEESRTSYIFRYEEEYFSDEINSEVLCTIVSTKAFKKATPLPKSILLIS